MFVSIWTLFIALAAASPAALSPRQSPDYGTVNFFWDTGCTQPAGTEYPANNVVQPGPAGVASMQWVQVTCTSVLCTTSPTLFACADANCNQARIVRVGQCTTYQTGVWAFWQRESATGAGTGTQPPPMPPPPPPASPCNPFPFMPPADEIDGR
ncbi:hypothetical protein KVR01_012205 [Diaporthe batatas]|uniref:uncharacterized protein n=1 Tax=Diaporthe batatas TaxID=748121 RepID=UPI001D03CC6B|nr:uncharacterized protein KVR01_012205 [Diaporthe batatas]KAG8157933.1 hypothetical protein KVR01_012205 [Diaporthe batatas]